MSKLVEELRKYVELKRSSTMRVTRTEAVELLAHIERLESALALAEKAIGGECDIANNCDLCQAYQAIQDIKSGGSLGAAAGKTDEEQEGI